MKYFFHKYGYDIAKMFATQFAISMFGSCLAMATAFSGKDALSLIASIGAIIFYLFLIYIKVWEIGSKDGLSVELGKKEYKPFTGVFIALTANALNFIIAILFTIGYPSLAAGGEWGSNICAVMKVCLVLFEGMYLGVLTVNEIAVNGVMQQLNNLWWPYFVIIIPSMIVCAVAYIFGHKNIHFTSLMEYQDPNQKKKNKK